MHFLVYAMPTDRQNITSARAAILCTELLQLLIALLTSDVSRLADYSDSDHFGSARFGSLYFVRCDRPKEYEFSGLPSTYKSSRLSNIHVVVANPARSQVSA